MKRRKSSEAPVPARRRRLSREDFLSRALDVLSRDGESKLRIERLVAALGVTEGSFYWHFEDRADFVHQLAMHWSERFTERVIDELGRVETSPEQVLATIQQIVVGEDLGRYDTVMRSWATHEPEVAGIVRSVDRRRLDTVRAQFKELGFQGEALEMRTRTFAVTLAFWSSVFKDDSKREHTSQLRELLNLLLRRTP